MKTTELKKVNKITENLKLLPTDLLISIYLFLKNLINEKIETGYINTRQLKELGKNPLLTDFLVKEINSWK